MGEDNFTLNNSMDFSQNWALTGKGLIVHHSEHLGRRGVSGMHVGTFNLEHVMVICGSFSALFSKLVYHMANWAKNYALWVYTTQKKLRILNIFNFKCS